MRTLTANELFFVAGGEQQNSQKKFPELWLVDPSKSTPVKSPAVQELEQQKKNPVGEGIKAFSETFTNNVEAGLIGGLLAGAAVGTGPGPDLSTIAAGVMFGSIAGAIVGFDQGIDAAKNANQAALDFNQVIQNQINQQIQIEQILKNNQSSSSDKSKTGGGGFAGGGSSAGNDSDLSQKTSVDLYEEFLEELTKQTAK